MHGNKVLVLFYVIEIGIFISLFCSGIANFHNRAFAITELWGACYPKCKCKLRNIQEICCCFSL